MTAGADMSERTERGRALTTSKGIATGAGMEALLGRPVRRGLKGAREGDVVER